MVTATEMPGEGLMSTVTWVPQDTHVLVSRGVTMVHEEVCLIADNVRMVFRGLGKF